jgi:hypothetical protein
MQCQKCCRDLRDDEPIYRVSLSCDGDGCRQHRDSIASVCAECGIDCRRTFRGPNPCMHCRRPVFISHRSKFPKYIVCGKACQKAVYALAWKRRQLPQRSCVVCGTLFQPKRTRALYCGSRCKQSAYRRRRKLADRSRRGRRSRNNAWAYRGSRSGHVSPD